MFKEKPLESYQCNGTIQSKYKSIYAKENHYNKGDGVKCERTQMHWYALGPLEQS